MHMCLSLFNFNLFFYTQDSKAHTPRFPKAKDEGWWLVLGDVDNKDLLALKRIGFIRGKTVVQMSFYTPERIGQYH